MKLIYINPPITELIIKYWCLLLKVRISLVKMRFQTMKFIGSAKITQQGQVSIPFDVRKKLDINLGDYIIFVEDEDGRVIVTKEIALPEK